MSAAVATLRWEMVEIATTTGLMEVAAVRVGCLAVHQELSSPLYAITHLPTGMGFATAHGRFESPRQAAAAAREIEKLRDWSAEIGPGDLAAIGPACRAICARHGGVPPEEKHVEVARSRGRAPVGGLNGFPKHAGRPE